MTQIKMRGKTYNIETLPSMPAEAFPGYRSIYAPLKRDAENMAINEVHQITTSSKADAIRCQRALHTARLEQGLRVLTRTIPDENSSGVILIYTVIAEG